MPRCGRSQERTVATDACPTRDVPGRRVRRSTFSGNASPGAGSTGPSSTSGGAFSRGRCSGRDPGGASEGSMIMTGYERALHDPRAAFGEPKQVLADRDLTADQKHAILESWRQDALRLSASESENMAGGEDAMLQRVCDALCELEQQTEIKP